MTLRIRRAVFAGAVACLFSMACGGGRQAVRTDPFGGTGTDEVLLTVHNNDFRDAVIYAYWNGFKERVGTVTGTRSQTFRMTWKSEWIQLQVDFIGSSADRVSDRIDVTQGDHLDYVILAQAN